jgi:hypothetical protein
MRNWSRLRMKANVRISMIPAYPQSGRASSTSARCATQRSPLNRIATEISACQILR